MSSKETKSSLHALQLHLRPRPRRHLKPRRSIEGSELQRVLMSTNKSIIYIKLPSEQTLPPPPPKPLPLLSPHSHKPTYSDYQEQRIRQTIREKRSLQLPSPTNAPPRYPSPTSPVTDQRVIVRNQHHSLEVDRGVDKVSIFSVDGSKLGYQNLKQKYLQLRQVSLPSKKRSHLMEGGRGQEDFSEQYAHFFKIEKSMMEQMSKGQPKEFLRTRVNGYRTIFHPAYKQPTNGQQPNQPNFSNFVRRKKMQPQHINPEKSVPWPQAGRQPRMGTDCTPWETEGQVLE